jgi:hypothetical protein
MLKTGIQGLEKYALISSCALFLFASTGFAGEAIEFSGSQQKPGTNKTEQPVTGNLQSDFSSKIFRVYRPGETVSISDFLRPKPSLQTPQPVPPPSRSKRDEDLLDRQKNWMFLSPKDEDKSESAEDALNVNQQNPFEPKKNALDRFLETKSGSSLNGDKTFSAAPDFGGNSFGARNENGTSLVPQVLFENPKNDKAFSKLQVNSLQPQVLDRNSFDNSSEKSRINNLWQNQFSQEAVRRRQEQQAQMKEFEGLFSSEVNSDSSAVSQNGYNIISSENLFGIQKTTTPNQRPDSFSSSAAASYSDPFKASFDTMSKLPSAVLGSSTITSPGANSRQFSDPPPAQKSLEPVQSISQPAILPFPKRHF